MGVGAAQLTSALRSAQTSLLNFSLCAFALSVVSSHLELHPTMILLVPFLLAGVSTELPHLPTLLPMGAVPMGTPCCPDQDPACPMGRTVLSAAPSFPLLALVGTVAEPVFPTLCCVWGCICL